MSDIRFHLFRAKLMSPILQQLIGNLYITKISRNDFWSTCVQNQVQTVNSEQFTIWSSGWNISTIFSPCGTHTVVVSTRKLFSIYEYVSGMVSEMRYNIQVTGVKQDTQHSFLRADGSGFFRDTIRWIQQLQDLFSLYPTHQ